MKGPSFVVIGLVGVWVSGCASPPPSKLNYAVARIESASHPAVMAAAERAVQEHFRVATVDPAAGVVQGYPVEGREMGRSGRVGDVLGTPRRVRRVGEVRVEEAGDAVKVFCKVLVQQYESDERRLFVREHSLSDLPTETPAAVEAATLPEQNAAWRARGRDKVLERRILRAIVEQVSTRTGLSPQGPG